jgi:deoxyadenosine/deoxycytidine kinase
MSTHNLTTFLPGHFLITIEGNIGCGKTTVIASLQELLMQGKLSGRHFSVLKEPVEEWRNVITPDGKHHNYLREFYKEPTTGLLPLQRVIFNSFKKLHALEVPTYIKIMERHIGSAIPFLDTMKEIYPNLSTEIKDFQYDLFNALFEVKRPGLIIYLQTTPEIVYQRLQGRILTTRKEETLVNIPYLQKIHKYHESWLNDPRLSVPVKIIDANQPASNILIDVLKILQNLEADLLVQYYYYVNRRLPRSIPFFLANNKAIATDSIEELQDD